MKFWSTRYVLYLLIPLAVVAAWWWESSEIERYQETPATTVSQPDYYLDAAQIWEFDEQGAAVQKLTASRLERYLTPNHIQFETPVIISETEQGSPWVLRADDGHSNDDGKTIQLNENVVMTRAESAQNSDFKMTTRTLALDTQTNIAKTESLVNIDDAARTMRGIGMEADLDNETYQLKGNVTGKLWQGSRSGDPQ